MIDNATIAAIATPAGEGGIGVVRISGTDAATIADPASGTLIDEVLLGRQAAP